MADNTEKSEREASDAALSDRIGIWGAGDNIKASSQAEGNEYAVSDALTDLDETIGKLADTANHLDGESVAKDLKNLDTALSNAETHLGTWDLETHKNIKKSDSITDNVMALGDYMGEMGLASTTKGNIAGGSFSSTNTVASNLESLDAAIGDLEATDVAAISGTDVATKLATLKSGMSGIDSVIGDIEHATGNYMGSTTTVAGKLVALDSNIKANADKFGTISNSINLGETGAFSSTNTIASKFESLDQAIGDLEATDEAIGAGNVATKLGLLNNKINTVDELIGDVTDFADATKYDTKYAASGATDLTSAVKQVDAVVYDNTQKITALEGNSVTKDELHGNATTGGDVNVGEYADSITIGKSYVDTYHNQEHLIAGMEVDTQGKKVEIATLSDDDALTNIALDGEAQKISLKSVDGDVSSGVEIDNINKKLSLVSADDDTKKETGVVIDNKDQTIFLGSKSTSTPQGQMFGVTVVSDFANGNSSVKIGDGQNDVTIADGNITADGDITATGDVSGKNITAQNDITAGGNITAHGDLQVDGASTFGSASGSNVSIADGAIIATSKDALSSTTSTITLADGNIEADGNITAHGNVVADGSVTAPTVIASTVTAGTVNADTVSAKNGSFSEGLTVGEDVTIANGKVSADEVDVASAKVSDSLTVGSTGNTVSISNGVVDAKNGVHTDGYVSAGGNITSGGNISADGNVTAGGDLSVAGASTFGDASGTNVKIEDGVITATTAVSGGTDKTVSMGNGTVTASDGVTVGTAASGVTLGSDGSITSNSANGKVEIADGGIIADKGITSKSDISATGNINAGGNITAQGTITASEIDITGGKIKAEEGEFDKLILGDNYATQIDNGTNAITSTYTNADKTLATVATLNKALGDTDSLVGKTNLAVGDAQGTATIADHLTALDTSIGNKVYTEGNVIESGESLTSSLDKLDVAVGGLQTSVQRLDTTVGQIEKLSADDYEGYAKGKDNLVDAVAAVDEQVTAHASSITDLDTRVTANTQRLDNVSQAIGEFNADGTWKNEIVGDGAVAYGTVEAASLTAAISQVNSNIGEGSVLDTIAERDVEADNNGVSSSKSVNANIAAVNSAIGDLKNISNGLKNLNNGADGAPVSVVAALDSLDSTLGAIYDMSNKNGNLGEDKSVAGRLSALDESIGNRADYTNERGSNSYVFTPNANAVTALTEIASNIGTAADLGTEMNGVRAGNTVNANIAAVNNAIGNVADLENTYFVSEATNVTDAVRVLDADIYQLAGAVNYTWQDLKKLHHEVRAGFASMAAMSALVPNARSYGKTSLSVGTGAYSGHGAVAVGGFHYITDNLMLNAGLAWGNSHDTSYRMGVTYSF